MEDIKKILQVEVSDKKKELESTYEFDLLFQVNKDREIEGFFQPLENLMTSTHYIYYPQYITKYIKSDLIFTEIKQNFNDVHSIINYIKKKEGQVKLFIEENKLKFPKCHLAIFYNRENFNQIFENIVKYLQIGPFFKSVSLIHYEQEYYLDKKIGLRQIEVQLIINILIGN